MRDTYLGTGKVVVDGVKYSVKVILRAPRRTFGGVWGGGRVVVRSGGYGFDLPRRPTYTTHTARLPGHYHERIEAVQFEAELIMQSDKLGDMECSAAVRYLAALLTNTAKASAERQAMSINSSHEDKHIEGVVSVIRSLEDVIRSCEVSLDGTVAGKTATRAYSFKRPSASPFDQISGLEAKMVWVDELLNEEQAKSALSYTDKPRVVTMTADEQAFLENLANEEQGTW